MIYYPNIYVNKFVSIYIKMSISEFFNYYYFQILEALSYEKFVQDYWFLIVSRQYDVSFYSSLAFDEQGQMMHQVFYV